MAVIQQYWQGQTGDQDRRSLRYLVTEATSDNDALDQMELDSPFEYDNMPRENISIRELSQKDGLYEAVARYTRRPNTVAAQQTDAAPINVTGPSEPTEENPDKRLFSFDVSVENQLEYFPDSVVGTGSGGNFVASDTGLDQSSAPYEFVELGGYNFDPEYGFRGRYIERPKGSFSLSIFPDDLNVTRSYQVLVMDTVGKVNSVRFRGYEQGEVMLVSARGESRNNADWQFEFTFQVKRTRTNVDLGNGVVFASVQGWDLVDPWYVSQTATAGANKVTVHRCRQAIVWRPYEQVDLGQIIIP